MIEATHFGTAGPGNPSDAQELTINKKEKSSQVMGLS
jgi:hypothetical protein